MIILAPHHFQRNIMERGEGGSGRDQRETAEYRDKVYDNKVRKGTEKFVERSVKGEYRSHKFFP